MSQISQGQIIGGQRPLRATLEANTQDLNEIGALIAVANNDLPVKLGDNSGTNKLSITDSDDTEIASIDSSGNITASSDITDGSGNVLSSVSDDLDGFDDNLKSLTSGEVSQLLNINTESITNTQWGYLGAADQAISTSDTVQFAGATLTGNADLQSNALAFNDGAAKTLSATELGYVSDGLGANFANMTNTKWGYVDSISEDIQNFMDAHVDELQNLTSGEVNILDGATLSTAELNLLDGFTGTTAHLNFIDGLDQSLDTASSVTFGGMSSTGDVEITDTSPLLALYESDTTDKNFGFEVTTGVLNFYKIDDAKTVFTQIATLDDSGNFTVQGNIEGIDVTSHGSRHESGGGDEVNHDNLTGFVANEHIDHSSVSIAAGTALSGGGDISSSRTLNLDINSLTSVTPTSSDEFAIYDNSNTDIRKTTFSALEGALDHDSLSGGTTNDAHHTKYTDAEAISAVEGEATLDVLHSDLVTVNSDDHHTKYANSDVESYLESQGFDPSALKFTGDLDLGGNDLISSTSSIRANIGNDGEFIIDTGATYKITDISSSGADNIVIDVEPNSDNFGFTTQVRESVVMADATPLFVYRTSDSDGTGPVGGSQTLFAWRDFTTDLMVLDPSTMTFSVDLDLNGNNLLTGSGSLSIINASNNYANLALYSERGTNDNALFEILFYGHDSGGNDTVYSAITPVIVDNTDTTENGKLDFYRMLAGTNTKGMSLETSGLVMYSDLNLNGNNALLGTGGLGNDASVLTFAAGATGTATFGGNVFVGGNGIGNDASVLTFATGSSGTATFGGNVNVGTNYLIDSIAASGQFLRFDGTKYSQTFFYDVVSQNNTLSMPSNISGAFGNTSQTSTTSTTSNQIVFVESGTSEDVDVSATYTDDGAPSGDDNFETITVYFEARYGSDSFTQIEAGSTTLSYVFDYSNTTINFTVSNAEIRATLGQPDKTNIGEDLELRLRLNCNLSDGSVDVNLTNNNLDYTLIEKTNYAISDFY